MPGLDSAKCPQRMLPGAPSWHACKRFPYLSGGIETGGSGAPN